MAGCIGEQPDAILMLFDWILHLSSIPLLFMFILVIVLSFRCIWLRSYIVKRTR